jgi:signal peptidase I
MQAGVGVTGGRMSDIDLEPDTSSAEVGARRRRRRSSSRRNTIEWVVVVAGALLVALVIKSFLFQAFYIPSSSMEPTLHVGDRVLVNKLSYRMHDVNRGDVVVFRRPTNSASTVTVQGCDGQDVQINRSSSFGDGTIDDLIKRVIALPGETVERREDGHIYVNGNVLSEPYLPTGRSTPAFLFRTQCIKVPDHDVFVLGDNRQNSQASNAFGPIEDNLIVGRAFVRVWPISAFGGI